MYQLIYSYQDGKVSGIKRLSDGASIPLADGNTDYQAFLVWNAEQAVPLDLNSVSQEILDANAARLLAQQKKMQAIIDNLPSRAAVKTAINKAFPDAKQNNIVTRLADIVYWLAKDKEE